MPATSEISSREASFSRLADPNHLRSAVARFSPRPGISIRTLEIVLDRFFLEAVRAKR